MTCLLSISLQPLTSEFESKSDLKWESKQLLAFDWWFKDPLSTSGLATLQSNYRLSVWVQLLQVSNAVALSQFDPGC